MTANILVNAQDEKREALNIILESATNLDRSYPGIGSGSVADIKVSLVLLGFNTKDSATTTVLDNKLIWSTLGSGATSREQNKSGTELVQQGSSAILFSSAGFVKNEESFWNTVRPQLKIESFSNANLVTLFKTTQARIQRVFFVNDIDDIEKYVTLFLPLFTSIN